MKTNSQSTGKLIDQFLAELSARQRTITAERTVLRQLAAVADNLPIRRVHRQLVDRAMSNAPYHPRWQRMARTVIQRFFNWCHARHFLPASHPLSAREFIPDPVPLCRILSVKEFRTFLTSLNDVEVIIYAVFIAFAGLRPSEVDTLSWESLNGTAGEECVFIRRCSHNACIPIPPVLQSWLRPFAGCRGKISGASTQAELQKNARKHQIRIHWLRHTCLACQLSLTGGLPAGVDQAGIIPSWLNQAVLPPVKLTEATKYFALTPEAIGFEGWPGLVQRYLHSRPNSH